jgi:hypothetical protein
MGLPSPSDMYNAGYQTADYLKSLERLHYLVSIAATMKSGAWEAFLDIQVAQYEAIAKAAADAALRAQMAALGRGAAAAGVAVVVPAVIFSAVLTALGVGYYQAHEAARKEEGVSGFSHGFVMGLLGWEWRHVKERFTRQFFRMNHYDEAMDVIRVNAYRQGLLAGFLTGLVFPPGAKKEYLRKIQEGAGASAAGWSAHSDQWEERMRAQRVQINYVIDLAVSARRKGIVKAE